MDLLFGSAQGSGEKAFKASLHADVRVVEQSKRLLLWESLLSAVKYPDMGVIAEMKSGVQLTVEAEITGLFKPIFKPIIAATKYVRNHSREFRETVLSSTISQGHLDATVLQKTLDERDKGWLVGPIHLDDIPRDALISRRFGITQGEKVRLIDDFSQSGVNLAVQSYESPQPQSTDVIQSVNPCCRTLSGLISSEKLSTSRQPIGRWP